LCLKENEPFIEFVIFNLLLTLNQHVIVLLTKDLVVFLTPCVNTKKFINNLIIQTIFLFINRQKLVTITDKLNHIFTLKINFYKI